MKVAQLRNVLLQNDVVYPTGAKKQDLVNLFNENIKPSSNKKLKELNSVVANDSGIEVVEKKNKKSSDGLKIEKVRKSKSKTDAEEEEEAVRDESPSRRSPRKVSKSKTEEVEVKKPTKRVSSKTIGDIPDLHKSTTSRARERSPARKSRLEEKPKSKTTRERSPSKKSSDELKVKKKTTSRISKKNKDSDNEVEQVFEAELNKSLKDSETSFSKENVFQSAESSPQFHKTIPKKRSTEESPKKSTKRKTAFSSYPIAEPRAKSPLRKTFEISKFEASSPSSVLDKDDIFNFGTDAKLDQVINKSPIKTSRSSSPVKHDIKSKIPELSKFTVSSEFANSFSSKINKTKEEENEEEAQVKEEIKEEINDEIPDVLDGPINDGSFIDSELFDLQEEFEEVKNVILEEAEEAVKQINEIFQVDDVEDEDQKVEEEKVEVAPKKSFNILPILSFFNQLFIFFFIVSTVISALWYREQRILIGYCGSEIDQPTFPNTSNEYLLKAEEFLQTVKPKCLRCPQNAICLPNLQLKCKQDYIVSEPWYKLYGLLPFEDVCIKDQEKENIINEILSKSLELLRTRNANTKCGDAEDSEVGISDEELYDFFFQSKSSLISDDEFNELWDRVLEDLKNEPEITVRQVF